MQKIFLAILLAMLGILLPARTFAYNYDDDDEPSIDVTDDDWDTPGTIAIDLEGTQTGIQPVANTAAPLAVTLRGKTVVVNTPTAAYMPVYTLDGRLFTVCNLLPGENTISLPDGFYIINRRKYKI